MALHYLFVAFFLIAFIMALFKWLFLGEADIFNQIMSAAFSAAETGFKLSLGLTGIMTLWLGFMRIAEEGGAVRYLAKAVSPLFRKLFPEIPKDHPVMGSIMMNLSANMLGLDNAATPLGLKAMEGLQELNSKKEEASNAQIMFLVLNTSGLTIIPVSIMVYRAQLGAANPSDIFLPILLSTFFSTFAGILATAYFQKLKLNTPVVWAYLGGSTLFISLSIWYFSSLGQEDAVSQSGLIANLLLFSIIISFIFLGLRKSINIYQAFIDGAKDGFGVAIKIIPYLVAMLTAIAVFRACGALDMILDGIRWALAFTEADTQFVEALPTAFLKPLSGSGARGAMVDAMTQHGADSLVGRMASTLQGATETTFYVLAVYFGSVGISKTRHALACGLIADATGIIMAILMAYLFFGS